MGGEHVVEVRLDAEDLLGLDADVGGLSLGAAEGLVDHDAGVRKGEALALGAGGEEDGGHAGGLADAVGRDVAGDELHRVVDGEAGGDDAPGRVDVDGDVLLGVLRLEEEELGDDDARDVVVDRAAEDDDPVLEEAGVDVVGPLAAARLFDYDGD